MPAGNDVPSIVTPPVQMAKYGSNRSPGDQELLERHRPYLRYDSQEAFRVASAETIAGGRSNLLASGGGSLIARPGGRGGPPLSRDLELLLRYPDGGSPTRGDRLHQGPDAVADGVRLQEKRRYANRVYGRVIREGRHTWLQYWLWYYFDQKQLFGFGSHEGDWETVQVGLDGFGSPELIIFSRHHGALARRWKQIERHRTRAGDHPVVYVAPFSHACYDKPGTHLYLGGIDNPDGKGPAMLPKLESFGDWCRWPGRWGRSRGILQSWIGVGFLGGRSPASPACQVTRWQRPTSFYRKARRRLPIDALGRGLCRLGKATRPGRPKITAHVDRDRAIIDYTTPKTRLRRARRLYVTVHMLDERARVLAMRPLRVAARTGTIEITLPYAPGKCVLRVSAFSFLRRRSETQEIKVSQCLSAARVTHAALGSTRYERYRGRLSHCFRASASDGSAKARSRDPRERSDRSCSVRGPPLQLRTARTAPAT
jgi:hypothetical protein